MEENFLLRYDGFGSDLVGRINEKFSDTPIEIPTHHDRKTRYSLDEIVPYMHIYRRAALTSVIAEDEELTKRGLFPITPYQSERFRQINKLEPTGYRSSIEHLGLILWMAGGIEDEVTLARRSGYGENRINHIYHLYKSILQNKDALEFEDDLEHSRLLIVNPGLERHDETTEKVAFKVIPGVTEIYQPKILKFNGESKDESKDDDYIYPVDNLWDDGFPCTKKSTQFSRDPGICSFGMAGLKYQPDSNLTLLTSYEQGGSGDIHSRLSIHNNCLRCEDDDTYATDKSNNHGPCVVHLAPRNYMNQPPLSNRIRLFPRKIPKLLKRAIQSLYYPAP